MKKGISVLSLVITMIVMVIMAGTIVGAGLNAIEYATINEFSTEILNVQTAVDKYYYKYSTYPSAQNYTLDITTIDSQSLSQFDDEIVTDNKIDLKIVNLSLLGITDNEFGTEEGVDTYVLSEVTGKVYYIQGVVYEDETYYTLTNKLYAVLNLDISNGLVSYHDERVYDVIFSPSTISYTNEPVTVKVKVPSQATVNNITISGGKSVSDETIEGTYKVITVNETSADRTGNYTIEVNYTYNEIEKTAKYSVDKYDNEAPKFTTLIQVVDGIKTINVSSTDNLSGVRTIKYVAKEGVDDEYLKKYAKVVDGYQINMSGFNGYTIYVEDNAGNYTKVTSKEVPENWRNNVITMYDGVPIPAGFTPSQARGENTEEEGLVIYEGTDIVTDDNVDSARKNRNQYVWVPVNSFTNFVRKDYISTTSKIVNTLGTESKFWEVIIDTTLNMPNKEQDINFVSDHMLAEVQEMYNSVKKYGGFYVARYEAGIKNERTALSDEIVTGKNNVYSMMGKKPYTWITWGNSLADDTGGAVQVARSLYTKADSDYGVISTLIYGVQWDAIMEWYLESGAVTQSGLSQDSVQYGNYRDYNITEYSEINSASQYAVYSSRGENNGIIGKYSDITNAYKKTSGNIHLLTTGALKAAKLNNIYDMAGNALEWTMEGRSTYGRVRRGGDCVYAASKYSLASRLGAAISGESVDAINGFRIALYIK